MLKKISLLLAVLFVLPISVISFAAEKTIAFSLGDVTGEPGQQVEVKLSCTKNPGVQTWELHFDYDKDNLKLISVNSEDGVFGELPATNLTAQELVITYVNMVGDTNVTGNVATLTFEINKNAKNKDYKIECTKKLAQNISEEKFDVTVKNGTITVKDTTTDTSTDTTTDTTTDTATDTTSDTDTQPKTKVLSGDVNGDSKVNLRDASFTLKCVLHKAEMNDLGRLAADVNNDNNVTATDSLCIQRYDIDIMSFNIGEYVYK